MTFDTSALIDQRPHLKAPLEFYSKWQQFQAKTDEHLSKNGSSSSIETSTCYPRESIATIISYFSQSFGLSLEELTPLQKTLESGEINFLTLPLGENPEFSFSNTDEHMPTLMFLLSRPYFGALRNTSYLDGKYWDNGLCPLCSAQPVLSTITEGPTRILHCSYCGTSGPYKFIGCPNCGTKDSSQLNTLTSEQEPGFRISVCDDCHSYVKIVDNSMLKEMTSDIADIASLPLDIIAQEKGYARMAPNSIGLKKLI